ncbi:hypothetical protein ACFLR8_00015 [Bacteroidota bacterium]
MKTLVFSLFLITAWVGLTCAQNIMYIPDTAFLSAIIEEGIDTDKDGLLSYEEAQVITTLDVSSKDITDMTGIKIFKNLTSLDCSNNEFESLQCSGMNLTSLNVSNNTTLTILSCGGNHLSSLDVSTCTSLEELYCGNNALSHIDITKNLSLSNLSCQNNQLTNLDVSNNENLFDLNCPINQITSLDVSNNKALWRLSCRSNKLDYLDISNNKALWLLDCSSNNLDSLDVSTMKPNNEPGDYFGRIVVKARDMTSLTKIILGNLYYSNNGSGEEFHRIDGNGIMEIETRDSPNVKFTDLIIFIPDTNFLNAVIDNGADANGDNLISNSEAERVKSLNVSSSNISDMTGIEALSNLETLDCSHNLITELTISNEKLTTLSISDNDSLKTLRCQSNLLSNLDVSNCSVLTHLECNDNQLYDLNVTNCSALEYLNCRNNQLTALQLTTNISLEDLDCGTNQLSSIDVSNCSILKRLAVSENQLTVLDISNNTTLHYCNCDSNQLNLLDISYNTELKELICSRNQLDTLDISNNYELGLLDCGGNELTALDVSNFSFHDCFWWCTGVIHVNDMPTLKQINLGNSFYVYEDWYGGVGFKHILEDYYLSIDTIRSPNIDFTGIVVYIPDTMFLYSLIEDKIDLNGDSLISPAEAETVTSLSMDSMGITELTGINAFRKIDTLICPNNLLEDLDVSSLLDLIYLDCSGNLLINLDISNNSKLNWLNCSENKLVNLDVSQNNSINYLDCSYNPSLKMICVHDIPLLFAVDTTESSNSYFSMNCGINNVDIPDVNFFNSLIEHGVDKDEDGHINFYEAQECTYLDISYKEISDMTGVEAFVNLRTLDCNGNYITSLNLSNCKGLKKLYCHSYNLTSLDVSQCTQLRELMCHGGQLTNLDISNCTALDHLNCAGNKLTALDISKNTRLKKLYCQDNQISNLDVSNNLDLEWLTLANNLITSIDIRENHSLILFDGTRSPLLTSVCVNEIPVSFSYNFDDNHNVPFDIHCSDFVYIPDKNFLKCLIDQGVDSNGDSLISYVEAESITSLSLVSEMPCLNDGSCIRRLKGIETFTHLDSLTILRSIGDSLVLTGNPGLLYLHCRNNTLTHMDVSQCPELEYLDCGGNYLFDLQISNSADLVYLNCSGYQSISLNLTNYTGLKHLNCSSSQLIYLDISKSNSLEYLDISSNPSLKRVCVPSLALIDEIPYYNTMNSPNVYFEDCAGPVIHSCDTVIKPELIEIISSESGYIYLVPGNTDNNLMLVRAACIDSVAVFSDSMVSISSGIIPDDGVYFLYAIDYEGNISDPKMVVVLMVTNDRSISSRFKIFPNPVYDFVTVETYSPGTHLFELYSYINAIIR